MLPAIGKSMCMASSVRGMMPIALLFPLAERVYFSVSGRVGFVWGSRNVRVQSDLRKKFRRT